MIELYEGVPGAGKSYHAVAERLLPWVRAGRRLFVYLDGFHLDRLAVFTGLALEDLCRQITVWTSHEQVLKMAETVEPGSAVVIDEAQTVFRALQRVDPALLRWLETHRHVGVDVLMMAQDYRQMTAGVTRLIEVTIKFRRLDRLGLRHRYQGFVRGNPEETEVIRTLVGRYDPKLYAYYSSYAVAGVREQIRGNTVLKSPKVILGTVGLVFGVAVMMWGPWGQASEPVVTPLKVPPAQPGSGARPQSLPAMAAASPFHDPLRSERRVVRVLGGAGYAEGENQVWRYLLVGGEILTASQIAGRYGITVSEVQEGGITRLEGEGVEYGPGEP